MEKMIIYIGRSRTHYNWESLRISLSCVSTQITRNQCIRLTCIPFLKTMSNSGVNCSSLPENCCTLEIDCGGFSGSNQNAQQKRNSYELSRKVNSISFAESREEALKRGGKTKNLLASKEETVIDFIKYLIENRISADKVRATI